jgi:type I restriction enzyme M protein
MRNFESTLDSIAMRYGHGETFKAFLSILVNFFADGKYNTERDRLVRPLIDNKEALNSAFYQFFEEYKAEIEADRREWIDPLGEMYEGWTGKQKRDGLGQFFTPPDICDMMARITIEPNATGTCLEPASGSARNILAVHAVAPALEFTAIEKDYTCYLLSAVNMYLNGCIGVVLWGDTISLELWQGLEIVRTTGPVAQVAPLLIVPFKPTPAILEDRSRKNCISLSFFDQEGATPAPPPASRPAPAQAPAPQAAPELPTKPQQLRMF